MLGDEIKDGFAKLLGPSNRLAKEGNSEFLFGDAIREANKLRKLKATLLKVAVGALSVALVCLHRSGHKPDFMTAASGRKREHKHGKGPGRNA